MSEAPKNTPPDQKLTEAELSEEDLTKIAGGMTFVPAKPPEEEKPRSVLKPKAP